jgi:type II secretory pathway component PulC
MRTSSTALVLALSFALVACGGAPPAQTAQREPSATPTPTTTAAVVPEKTTSLRRSALKQTIQRGLGYVLQDIMVEDYPVMHGDKFHGFKIQTISAAWGGVDLRPGDVVTRVNGLPIEHPEEADAALRSLEKARALRVDYERDGKARTLELPITED